MSAERDAERDQGSRARRLARNEVFFRDANELLEREAGRRLSPQQFICECSLTGCLERIALPLAEYEHARSRPEWFIVTPGHEDRSIEDVVERHGTYVVVEKKGVAGSVARRRARR